jgi:hypothetical protein
MAYPCLICGADLYETNTTAVCSYCGRDTPAAYLCPEGHHVCDDCQLAEMPELVARVCHGTHEKDAGAIVNLIMKHPGMPMHGPQHHYLVAPVMLAALSNAGQRPLQPGRAAAAIQRTSKIPFAVCGLRGACGAAESVGALVAILTGASYLKGPERALALRATARALDAVAEEGGPRCCKQSVYLSLETAVDFLRAELGLDVPLTIHCTFAQANPECKQEDCRYYER